VDLDAGRATVSGRNLNAPVLVEAVESLGYHAEPEEDVERPRGKRS
jgi:hypothetical protein